MPSVSVSSTPAVNTASLPDASDAGEDAAYTPAGDADAEADAAAPAVSATGSTSSSVQTEMDATVPVVVDASEDVDSAPPVIVPVVPPSCLGLPARCGESSESCCTSLPVAGGEFELGDPDIGEQSDATIASFALDKYEVTVGRLRQFVGAYEGPPSVGAGAHPLIADSGWQTAWNGYLPSDRSALAEALHCDPDYATWDSLGTNDRLPLNCVDWYTAFAFCGWDGGRLPTEAEWEYAAAGGDEERTFPWGDAEPNATLAVEYCLGDGVDGCAFSDIQSVGSRRAGEGRFGQLDLAGSMAEWTLDWHATYPSECSNCGRVASGSARVFRGGAWRYDAAVLTAAYRSYDVPSSHLRYVGLRCARDL